MFQAIPASTNDASSTTSAQETLRITGTRASTEPMTPLSRTNWFSRYLRTL